MCIILSCCALLGAVEAETQDGWWDRSWTCRQRVHFNATLLDEDLSDFPLGIRLGPGQFAAAKAQPNGADVRAVGSDGALLDYEVVQWTAERAELYVKVPRITAGQSGQYIDIYYGNPSAPPAPAAKPVWEPGYRLVMHFMGTLDNATRIGKTVQNRGLVPLSDVAVFGKDDAYLVAGNELLDGVGEQITLSVRFKAEKEPGLQTLVSGVRKEPLDWFNFGIKVPESVVHTNAVSAARLAGELNVSGLTPNEWHSAVVRYDARKGTRTLCVDGIMLEHDHALPGPLNIRELRIGRGVLHFEGWQFHGALDEMRLAHVARSDSWVRAEAACLAETNALLAVGPPQAHGEPEASPTPFSLIAPSNGTVTRTRSAVRACWYPSAGAKTYSLEIRDADNLEAPPLVTFDAGAKTEWTIPSSIAPGKKLSWTVTAKSAHGETKANEQRTLSFYDWSKPMTATTPKDASVPVLSTARDARADLRGYLRKRIDKVVQRYYLETPESSPAILQVLRDRDKSPVRDPLVPWAGEFAGKYLTGAQLAWRLTRDEILKRTIDAFARDLIDCQADNGYLGPFPASSRLIGRNWDVWGHYHCMYGLMLYYEDTGYAPALEACKKAADLLFETFGPGGPTLTNDDAGGQMNMAVCHALVLLYRKTGIERYLELARYIAHEAWNEPNAGRYLESALAGKHIIEFPQHRWEAIHDWQALAELHWLTGELTYRGAAEHIYWDGVRGDRHNSGGITSGEGFCGSPYNQGAIETCCTVAWIAYSVDMLRLLGDSRIADEIEWSTLNSALGAIPYSGRACAYNVPMDGTRCFGVELPWQAPKAGPDLNCCAVNAARPLGMISQWALMQDAEGLVINYYGPATLSATLPSGKRITLEQETEYPVSGHVRLKLVTDAPETFALRLRIPVWSKAPKIAVNGQAVSDVVPGKYYPIARQWQSGDVVEIEFDFGLRFWVGEKESADKVSVYRGPLLYAFDGRYNATNPDEIPELDTDRLTMENASWSGAIEPWSLAKLKGPGGVEITVCDFSSAGQTGNVYRSWLPLRKK